MLQTKDTLIAALCVLVALVGTAGPGWAQAGIGGGYGNYTGYPDVAGCEAECGSAYGTEGPTNRVQRTTGARYEHIVIGPQGQVDAVRRAIEQAGGTVIRSSVLAGLGEATQIATFPSAAALAQAQALIAQLAPESALALHHLYGFAQAARSPRLYAASLIGEAAGPGGCRLARSLAIGMIDGPINPDHPALQGADVTYDNIVPGHDFPDADHGTAVAALLVGEDSAGQLAGYARGARLHAIAVFARRDAVEEASVERIVDALDRMVRADVRLINLSIAGPQNAALARALHAAAARGVVLVAASGNDRRPLVSWPAASADVIAVTAIDAARRRFRLANTGAQIEFAAPGVDVYAARARGAGYVSGTSFAAPIVTALAARVMAHGVQSVDGIRAQLRTGVETLGPGTRNTEFGWGLVKAGGC